MFITEEIIMYILFAVNILLILWIVRLEIKTRDIGILKDKKSLIGKFKIIEKRIDENEIFEENIKTNLDFIQNKLQDNIQNIKILRFNPFKNDGIGGDQSFAISLLNKKGSGAIISSLYAREKVSVFAKPIENWQSKYELSEEEKSVLEKTKKEAVSN
ncbi:MAG: DUF4446 family protein [Patescibacteria group bacterium]